MDDFSQVPSFPTHSLQAAFHRALPQKASPGIHEHKSIYRDIEHGGEAYEAVLESLFVLWIPEFQRLVSAVSRIQGYIKLLQEKQATQDQLIRVSPQALTVCKPKAVKDKSRPYVTGYLVHDIGSLRTTPIVRAPAALLSLVGYFSGRVYCRDPLH